MKTLIKTTLAAATIALAALPFIAVRATASTQTVTNLYTALVAESNAANRYAKFAQFGEFQGFFEYPFCAKPLVTPDQIVIHARQKNHDCGGIANGSQLGHEIDPTHGR